MRYLVMARKEFAEPLELVAEVDVDGEPTVEALGVGDDWLELVAVPEPEIEWITSAGVLVHELAGGTSGGTA